MYKINPGVVNGGTIRDLLELCNENFINPMIQPYAGANRECQFCGATETREGGVHHSAADCPVIKYQDVVEKYKKLIVKK